MLSRRTNLLPKLPVVAPGAAASLSNTQGFTFCHVEPVGNGKWWDEQDRNKKAGPKNGSSLTKILVERPPRIPSVAAEVGLHHAEKNLEPISPSRLGLPVREQAYRNTDRVRN